MTHEANLDKRLIADSFSRAATSYDQVAHLQRQVGERLLSKYPWQNNHPLSELCSDKTIIDLGCGTGSLAVTLAQMGYYEKIGGLQCVTST